MNKIIKISIIEPSFIIRSGLTAILHRFTDCQTDVSEIPDVEHLKTALPWQKPDILIINPMVTGVLSLAQIRKLAANQAMKCVALQNSLSDNASLKAYDDTISIYDSADLIHKKIIDLVQGTREDTSHESLTAREKEIIVYVIKGLTNNQIAERLNVSAHTVVSHRRNISSKLQIHSAAGLTVYAIVNNLVELSELN